MTIVPIVIPKAGGTGNIADNVTWETTCVPSIESDPFTDGIGCTVAIFGYLADIWARTCHPLLRTVDEPLDIEGSGEYQNPSSVYRSLAIVRMFLQLPPPVASDLIFGNVPIYYLGMCGWGNAPRFGLGYSAGPTFIQGSVSFGESSKAPPKFINHQDNYFIAPSVGYNTFWWHLKPGVRGTIYPQVTDYGYGATGNVPEIAQTWMPSYGGWCPSPPSPFGQVFDGCGKPACA